KTLIVGESFGGKLTAFDIEGDGKLSNKREWADIRPAVPDGIALDAEGAVWVASATTHEVIRVHENETISERVQVENNAYACMLGGTGRKTLFVLTAASSDPGECASNPTGRIEIAQVEVPGAGLP